MTNRQATYLRQPPHSFTKLKAATVALTNLLVRWLGPPDSIGRLFVLEVDDPPRAKPQLYNPLARSLILAPVTYFGFAC